MNEVTILFGLMSLLPLFAGIYEWDWLWRSARGWYLPDIIGIKNTRLLYIFVGILGIAGGIYTTLQIILSNKSQLIFVPSFIISYILCDILFKNHVKQSLFSFIRNKNINISG
jgi:hypothetical protein